jgi:DNA-binding CsgD family transcriptional regulator
MPPEALARRISSALTTAIPVDGYRLFGVDPGSLLINRLLAASDTDSWARAEWLRDVYLRSGDFSHIELPSLMRAGLTAVVSHESPAMSWGYVPEMLARLPEAEYRRRFHELRSPIGGTILASFPADGRWVAALQAYRRDPARPFRASDVAFVRQLAPTIGQALAASLRAEHARSVPVTDQEPAGIVVIDREGDIQFATPAGGRWCQRIGDDAGGRDDLLPTAAWAAVARLRERGGGAASVVVSSRGGSVRVEASPADADGSVAVVFAPERPPAPPQSPPFWPLTAAERRVVDLALIGCSNAQIAERAFITVNTVEWHLRSAYEKLGVRSRAGLLAQLFSETAAPDLFVGGPARG